MKTRLTLLCTLAACNGRTLDDEVSRPIPDVAEGREPCTSCNGVCVDLETDSNNCGTCGHTCRSPEIFGPCEEGECPSALWCGSKDQGLYTCDDVCAYHGQSCDDGPPQDRRVCGGNHVFYQAEGSALGLCENGGEPSFGHPGACTEDIDWTLFPEPGQYTEAVGCCCTQEPV